jgi:outer membrane lipoprotein carrier protein
MKYLIFAALLISSSFCWSQENAVVQDPAAGQILDRVSLKFKVMQSIRTDFELLIEDRKENMKNSSSGHLLMKQKKYKLDAQGSTVFFNGVTMWTYVLANNEVTITQPDQNAVDYSSNPLGFFTTYKNDFKYRYVGQVTKNGVTCHQIDLIPKNLNQPYSRIRVFINMNSDMPEVIISMGKDGIDYTVTLKNTVLNQEIPDAIFTFDPAKYKKPEIIDMRGL